MYLKTTIVLLCMTAMPFSLTAQPHSYAGRGGNPFSFYEWAYRMYTPEYYEMAELEDGWTALLTKRPSILERRWVRRIALRILDEKPEIFRKCFKDTARVLFMQAGFEWYIALRTVRDKSLHTEIADDLMRRHRISKAMLHRALLYWLAVKKRYLFPYPRDRSMDLRRIVVV